MCQVLYQETVMKSKVLLCVALLTCCAFLPGCSSTEMSIPSWGVSEETAHKDGQRAYREGLEPAANPYVSDTDISGPWLDGYLDAKEVNAK
jgi:hypothetical protein